MPDYSVHHVRFTSSDGHSRVHGWVYAPNTPPIAMMQISHGMCEYIGRYHWFMESLCQLGFVVFGNDHIGHGDSSQPEDYGYFADKNGYRHLISDLHRMTVIVKEKYPELPLFLFGHSMGSFVARLYLSKYAHEIDGAILCGSSGPNPLTKGGILAASAVIQMKGPRHRSSKLSALAFGNYNSKYEDQHTSHDWLTRNPAVVNFYKNDPKCTFLFTASGLRDLFTMLDLCNSRKWFHSLPKGLPILLISGDMDPVGNYGKGIITIQEKLLEAGMYNVSMTLYPEARHELLQELNREEVLTDIYHWMKDQLPLPF